MKQEEYIFSGIDKQFQANLVNMQEFAKENEEYRYLMTVIVSVSILGRGFKIGDQVKISKWKGTFDI